MSTLAIFSFSLCVKKHKRNTPCKTPGKPIVNGLVRVQQDLQDGLSSNRSWSLVSRELEKQVLHLMSDID